MLMVWWNDISVWTNVHFLEIVWSHHMVWSIHMFFPDESFHFFEGMKSFLRVWKSIFWVWRKSDFCKKIFSYPRVWKHRLFFPDACGWLLFCEIPSPKILRLHPIPEYMRLRISIGMPNFEMPDLDSVNHCTSKEINWYNGLLNRDSTFRNLAFQSRFGVSRTRG